jgi:hypothetical protein
MSAIPGGAVVFEFTANSTGVDRAARDAEQRIARMQVDVGSRKIDATPKIDKDRLQKDADDAKRILRDVQKEADRLFAQRQMGSGAGVGFTGSYGGGFGPGAAPGAGGAAATGGDMSTLLRGVSAAAIAHGAAAAINAATTYSNLQAASARGDLAAELAQQDRLSSSLRSVPLGAGALGGAIHDFAYRKDQQQIDDTLFEAQQQDQRSAFMARQNERMRAERDLQRSYELTRAGEAGATPSELAAKRLRQQIEDMPQGEGEKAMRARATELENRAMIERGQIEGRHRDQLQAIRDRAAAEQLRADGYTVAAERKILVDGAKQTEEELKQAILTAQSRGDTAAAERARQTLEAAQDANTQRIQNFDKQQEEERLRSIDAAGAGAAEFMRGAGNAAVERAERRRRIDQAVRDEQFEARQVQLEARGMSRTAEVEAIGQRMRERLESTEDPELRRAILQRAETELTARRVTAEVVRNPMLTNFGAGGDGGRDQLTATRESRDLLKQIRDELRGGVPAVTS